METTTIWALGDYPAVARDVVWDLGSALVSACDIAPGGRVLDVGAGTGNAAIRAAEAGAQVVASDLEPALVEAGRRAANGAPIEWVVADAQALPFADGEFDAVLSCIGAMFAPDHRATAAELARVCRPGGTIGMLNWTPEGMVGGFFGVFAPYAPLADGPPPVGLGQRGARARAARRACRVAALRAREPRGGPLRAPRRPVRVLQAQLRPDDRRVRERGRRGRARPWLPRVRRALEPRRHLRARVLLVVATRGSA